MGRVPKAVDHHLRRAELVGATWRVIADEGIGAATIRRIAEVAECTTGRVTHYFASKDEVLLAALQQVHDAVGARMLRHLQHLQQEDPPAALRAVLLEALPLDDEKLLEWRVMLAFFGRSFASDQLRTEQERRYDAWRALLDHLVTGAAPERSIAERRALVDLITATVDGLGTHAVLEPSTFSPPRLRRVVDLLVEASSSPQPSPAPG
jgi:AcrR family transcriptional regulator